MLKNAKIKKILAGAMMFFMLTIAAPRPTAADVEQSTIDYLKGQSQSAWITLALAAAGETILLTEHLQSVNGTLVTDYAITVLALTALNLNPSAFGSVDYIAKIKEKYQNNQLGDETSLNDDFWGILALASAGVDIGSLEISNSKNFILAHQNIDGGFSWSTTADSDTNDTAAAILALIEAGQSAGSQEIINALNYLASAQNDDGGFFYDVQGESDVNSTAWAVWAIRKAGQNPTSWQKGANNPITYIQSMKNYDGSYGWKASVPAGNLGATKDAAIALSGKTLPLSYYNPIQPGSYHLRIEGSSGRICDAYVTATNALDIIENGADVCGYTYNITQETWGPYLRQINNDLAEGMFGWLGFLNYESFFQSADSYNLQAGDEVLYYYGEWGWQPLRLTIDNQAGSGEILEAAVESYGAGDWQVVSDAIIRGGDRDYITGINGQAELNLPDGTYNLYALKAGFVRSEQHQVIVGDSVSQTVGLLVEIEQDGSNPGIPDSGTIAGDSIIFEVNPNELNFGKLKPGQSGSQTISLSNGGESNLQISAQVAGNQLFKDNIKLDGNAWTVFSKDLSAGQSAEAAVSLIIPGNYLESGVKIGELIFWAIAK